MIKKYLDIDNDEERDYEEEMPVEMVEDYKGDEIPKSEAVWCDGGVWCHEDEALWSEYVQVYVTPENENYVWIDGFAGGDYMHRDYLTYSERDGEYYMSGEVTWCEYEEDYCLNEDATECDNGKYAFTENVVEDSEGRTQHKKDVTYDEETREYIYNG